MVRLTRGLISSNQRLLYAFRERTGTREKREPAMRRVYRDTHILLISTLLLAAVAFEASSSSWPVLGAELSSLLTPPGLD